MKDYTFLSSDGKTKIHSTCWECEGTPKAGLVVVHGMIEHRRRYEDFARYISSDDFVVVTYDQLGHGESVISDDNLGYFGHPDGNEYLVSDIHKQVCYIKQEYGDVPVFLLGHSMGSFLVREYICRHGKELKGTIIVGTGFQSEGVLKFGKIFSNLISIFGWHHRSKLLTTVAFGSYLKRIKAPRTSRDWISRDEEIVNRYVNDPWCMFTFTVDGFYGLIKAILGAQNVHMINKIPKELPLVFLSGSEDPVGQYQKGVLKAKGLYERAGIKNIKCKFYKNDRHEILNELDRKQVYKDILVWMNNI